MRWGLQIGLPDEGEEFSANVLLPGLVASHDAFGRGKDGDTHAIEHFGDLSGTHILTHPRAGHTTKVIEDGGGSLIFGFDLEDRVSASGINFIAPDVSFFLKDAGDFSFDFAVRSGELDFFGAAGIFPAGQEVGNRVCKNGHII